jgi:molybdate transport system substrate-binding protein
VKTLTGVLVATLLVATAGCSPGTDERGRTLTVLAASSLTGTFTDLAAEFEAEHPGVHVRLVFDSSATLAQMAVERAPGDVLATADRKTMDGAVADDGTDGKATQFATNELVLAVPEDNPAGIRAIGDLDQGGVDYLTCVDTAPCGAAAESLLRQDAVTRKPASQEVDVKSVLTKLESGGADAGFVYRTDVIASHGSVTAVEVPEATANPNTYWVAPTAGVEKDAVQRELARAWIRLLTGKGRAVLTAAGFGTAP